MNKKIIRQAYNLLQHAMAFQNDRNLRRDLQDLVQKGNKVLNDYCPYLTLADKLKQKNDHNLSIEEVIKKYETNLAGGLDESDVKRRQELYEKNELNQVKDFRIWIEFLKGYFSPMAILILISAIFYIISYDKVDMIIGSKQTVVVAIILFGFYVTLPLLHVFSNLIVFPGSFGLKITIPDENYYVFRTLPQGKVRKLVHSSQLVVGDVIQIITGQTIPADLRIIENKNLTIKKQFMKDENKPFLRSSNRKEDNFIQSDHIALCSSRVFSGNGIAIVISVGKNTVLGNLQKIVNDQIHHKYQQSEKKSIKSQIQQLMTRIFIFTIILFIFLATFLYCTEQKSLRNTELIGGLVLANTPSTIYILMIIFNFYYAKKISTVKNSCKDLQGLGNLGMTDCLCITDVQTMKETKINSFLLYCNNPSNNKFLDITLDSQSNVHKQLKDLYRCVMLTSNVKFHRKSPLNKEPQQKLNQRYKQFIRKQESNKIINNYYERINSFGSQRGLSSQQQNIRKLQNEETLHDLPLLQRQIPFRLNESQVGITTSMIIQHDQNSQAEDHTHFIYQGNPYETVILKHFERAKDFQDIRQKYPTVTDKKGRQLKAIYPNEGIEISVHQYPTVGSDYCIFIKGNPLNIWRLSTHVQMESDTVELGFEQSRLFEEEYKNLTKKGNKIIGFAKYHISKMYYNKETQMSISQIQGLLNQLTFIGAVALESKINQSLIQVSERCRAPGIRLIMLTDLDEEAVTVLARKNGIITRPYTANQIAEKKNLSMDESLNRTNAVILTDQLLRGYKKNKIYFPFSTEQQRLVIQANFNTHIQSVSLLNDQESNNLLGQRSTRINLNRKNNLAKSLSKHEIVTGRTNNFEQYLIIRALKLMGQNVTFLSSKNQDFHSFKIADVSICRNDLQQMKNFADLTIDDDDVTTIMDQIKEGRRILENIKKSICFILCSNIPLMMPFILNVFILLPVHGSFLLYVALINNLLLGVSLMFEDSEIDVITRKMHSKEYRLYSLGMIFHSHGYVGWTQFWGAFFTFLVVANDFGFPPLTILTMNGNFSIIPQTQQNYQGFYPNSKEQAMSKFKLNQQSCQNVQHPFDWGSKIDLAVDLRYSTVYCQLINGIPVYSKDYQFGTCKIQQVSSFTNKALCYTGQGIKYAQSAYFYAILICQFINFLSSRTLRQPFRTKKFNNKLALSCITFSIFFFILIGNYVPFNIAFGTRDNIFMHYGTPVIPFALLQLLIDEIRKFFIRNLLPNKTWKPHWFVRAASF